jgi:dolichol-phosphate mannosyltransferase
VQERGLASAVHWGVQVAHGDVVVVMDGDGQHDPTLIPRMVEKLAGGADIVSGSRFLGGAPVSGLSSSWRVKLSENGNRLINLFLGRPLTDPLTGFFALSRGLFLDSIPRLQADGFKVFFDLAWHNRGARIEELPFEFRRRQDGASKLGLYVFWLLLCDMVAKLSHGILPPRLVSFVAVGVTGFVPHFSVLYLLLAADAPFWVAQAAATIIAMVFNFSINNVLTYSDKRLRGGAFWKGLLIYSLIASAGIVANVSTAQLAYVQLKGQAFLASIAGLVIDVIWRFVMSNRLVWGRLSRLARKHLGPSSPRA